MHCLTLLENQRQSPFPYGYDIALDAKGNVYTTGNFQGVVDFDPGDGEVLLNCKQGTSGYTCKLDSDGNFLWVKNMNVGEGYLESWSIAVDTMGNVYTGGYFGHTVDFDPGPEIFSLTSNGSDAFVCKLDTEGDFLWARQTTGNGYAISRSIALDSSGSVYFTGYFDGVVDFDPGIGKSILTSQDIAIVYVSKFDSSGDFVWVKPIASSSGVQSFALDVDIFRNVLVTGRFFANVKLDIDEQGSVEIKTDNEDCFIAKLKQQTLTTGFLNNNENVSFEIYPNPASGTLLIQLGETLEHVNISLKNNLGEIIQTNNYYATDKLNMTLEGYVPGIYVISITTPEGRVVNMKVVKN